MKIKYEERYRDLGLNISLYRKKKKMTQAEFAEALDISLGHVGGIEQGKHSAALDLIWEICDVLDVTPRQLFDFRD